MAAPDRLGEDLARIFFAPRFLLRLAQWTMSEKGTARCLTQLSVLQYGYKFGLSAYEFKYKCNDQEKISVVKEGKCETEINSTAGNFLLL